MKTRKLLAIILAVAMLASFVSIPVFAEGEGTSCETLGILVGPDEDGVTDAYLATIATRAQAALVNLRLLGLEADALAFDGEETFTDAADATEFWQPMLEYLKATPAVGWIGFEDGSFMPNAAITGQAFTKVLLVALGYEEGVDFTWETVMDFAEAVGLEALADKADADLTVEDLAVALVEALGTKTNSATDVTLLSQLVMDGVIDAADAEAAGFEVEEAAFVIVSAGPTATKEVTVEMSTDVPEGTVVTLKKGTAGYVFNEVVDGSTITLTALFALPKGIYTVTVGDSSADFEVMAQYAADLALGTDSIFDVGAQDLKVALLDQYGDSMSLTGTNYSVFNQSTGYVFTPVVTTTIKITPDEDINPDPVKVTKAASADDVIFVFVYDPASQLTVSGEIVVLEAPYIVSVSIGGVTLGKIGDVVQTTLYQDTLGNVLDIEAVDQYGNPYILSAADIVTGSTYANKIQILSSNNAVISAAEIVATGPDSKTGDLKFNALAPGSAMLTLIIPDQAFIATSEMITVYATAALKSVTTDGPIDTVYAMETAKFPIAGFDQYGATAKVASGNTDVTFTMTKDLGGAFTIGADNTVHYTPEIAGTTTVYYFFKGIFVDTFDVTANAAAYPFAITGVTVSAAFETGATEEIEAKDLTVVDQYNRVIAKWYEKYTGYSYEVVSTAALDSFNLAGSWVTAAGETKTDDFAAYLTDVDPGTTAEGTITSTGLKFTLAHLAIGDIDSLTVTVKEAGPMYMSGVSWMYNGMYWTWMDNFQFDQMSPAYYKTLLFKGVKGDMDVLLNLDDGVPEIVDLITSTSDDIETDGDTVMPDDNYKWLDGPGPDEDLDASTTIKVWIDGEVVGMVDIDLSLEAPEWVATTVDFDTGETAFEDVFTKLTDQYGVVLGYTSVLGADSPDGSEDYMTEYEDSIGTDGTTIYTIVRWDGKVFATYTASKADPLNVTD